MTRGAANYQWKGGVAEYPNHYEMKQNRLKKLQQVKCKCEVCGNKANTIHHKDGSKDNHSLKNLIVLCRKCHRIIDNPRDNLTHTSKYIRKYGMTLREMGKKLKISASVLGARLKNPTISKELRQQTLRQMEEISKNYLIAKKVEV